MAKYENQQNANDFSICSSSTSVNDTIFYPNFILFAACYQHTFFTWVPVCYLWIFTPLCIFMFRRNKNAPLKWHAKVIAKLVSLSICVCSLLLCLICASVGYNGLNSSTSIFSRILLLISAMDLVILTLCCRVYGIISSGFVFTSLLIFLIFGFFEFFYSAAILMTLHIFDDFRLKLSCYSFILYYLGCFITFLLACFADQPVLAVYALNESPEKQASFLNRITFWWFNDLAIKGWKKPIGQNDLWDLNVKDTADSLFPQWEQFWKVSYDSYCTKKLQRSAIYHDDRKPLLSTKRGSGEPVKSTISPSATELPKPSVLWPAFCVLKTHIFVAVFLRIMGDLLQFASPLLLNALIAFVQDKNENRWRGYFYTVLLLGASTLCTFMQNYSIVKVGRAAMNLRSMLTAAIFAKSLKLSNASAGQRKTGEIVNLMAIDVPVIQEAVVYLVLVISCPLQIVLSLYFLYWQLGLSILAGLAILIALIPANYVLTSWQRKFQIEQAKQKDGRFKLINEMLNGMKVLKLYAWEEAFEKRIGHIRNLELKALKKLGCVSSVSMFAWNCAPFMIAVACFACFVFIQNGVLSPQRAFVSLALFNLLRLPAALVPMVLSYLVRANVSNKRIKECLVVDEVDSEAVHRTKNSQSAVSILDGDFSWSRNENEKSTLSGINLEIEPGKLVAIVGSVGSGKTSLLCAIMGELNKKRGSVSINCCSLSYVPQMPWILNSTLRENITFNKSFDEPKFKQILQCCELEQDLIDLQASDQTELGEKGVNLSGGQKQRINIARAAYNSSDIYLMDDPLSSVDPQVGSRIFRNLISNRGLLKSSTRIIVTNGLQYLKHFDHIIVTGDGLIKEQGSHDQLLKSGGAFADLLVKYISQKIEKNEDGDDNVWNDVLTDLDKIAPDLRTRLTSSRSHDINFPVASDENKAKKHNSKNASKFGISGQPHNIAADKQKLTQSSIPANKLIQEEAVNFGRVKTDVYLTYIKAMGYWAFIISVILMLLSNALGVAANVWLSNWSDQNAKGFLTNQNRTNVIDNTTYIFVYASMGISQAVLLLVCALIMTTTMAKAGEKLHSTLIARLLLAPLKFFETTPMGRILNRCGKDIDIVDTSLAQTTRTWLGCVLNVIATLFVISWAQKFFILAVVPLCIIYCFILRFYISTSRQLKRIESTTRSPIFAHFQETLAGLVCIRAFSIQKKFFTESNRRIDENQACFYPNFLANRWLGIRLEMIGNVMAFCAALFAVINSENSTGGEAGLAILYAFSITQALTWAVRMTSEVETNIVAVERIAEYSQIETEADRFSKKDADLPKTWPNEGKIEFHELSARYRPGLDFSLKKFSCKIGQAEKVGIVGRTGAGKSSICMALFRTIEADSGKIFVDDVDISQLGLKTLRSHLSLIPQDPTIFSGTVRFNLDPFGGQTDAQLWAAIEKSHLKPLVSNMPANLDEDLGGSSKLSYGQMQLLCLARALLRKTKILVMDEATASVDYETDNFIQQTIRREFSDCTILTIAHRINTIVDSDKIMVLASGQLIEFDDPQLLLSNKSSVFSAMAKETDELI